MNNKKQRRKNEETPVAVTTEVSIKSSKPQSNEKSNMKSIAQEHSPVKSSSLIDLIDKRDKILTQADSLVSLVSGNDNVESVSNEIVINTLWCVNDLLDELKSVHRLMDDSKTSLRIAS